MIELEEGDCFSERGNILLVGDEGYFESWTRPLAHTKEWINISWRPDNYPALNVSIHSLTDEELWGNILRNCGGMYVRKLNLAGAPVDLKYIPRAGDEDDEESEDSEDETAQPDV